MWWDIKQKWSHLSPLHCISCATNLKIFIKLVAINYKILVEGITELSDYFRPLFDKRRNLLEILHLIILYKGSPHGLPDFILKCKT